MTCDPFLSGWPNRLRPVSAVQYGPVRSEGYGKGNMGSRYFLTCCKYLLCVISVAAAQLLSLFLRGGQKLRGARLGSGSGLSDEFLEWSFEGSGQNPLPWQASAKDLLDARKWRSLVTSLNA